MSDLNNNKKSFNLPAYIQTPLFLYKDNRLDRPALLIASFFYSLHTAGQTITASTDYLCELATVKKRQLYNILNQLEEYQYIQRGGFTNRKKLKWVYCPNSTITVIELDASAIECTSVQPLNTSAIQCTKLVHSSALDYCTPLHKLDDVPLYDTKEDTKDYKKLTTVAQPPSSSSFFSEKQKTELLSYKIKSDARTEELFLSHCVHHIEQQTNDNTKFQRFTGLKHILVKLYDTQEPFKAKGFSKEKKKECERTTSPTKEEFENWKNCIPGFEWVGLWRQKNAKQG